MESECFARKENLICSSLFAEKKITYITNKFPITWVDETNSSRYGASESACFTLPNKIRPSLFCRMMLFIRSVTLSGARMMSVTQLCHLADGSRLTECPARQEREKGYEKVKNLLMAWQTCIWICAGDLVHFFSKPTWSPNLTKVKAVGRVL